MPKHATDLERSFETVTTGVRDSGLEVSIATSETGVRLVHRATGLVVMATGDEAVYEQALAFERMAEKLKAAQHRPKRRRPTRPTRSSVRRRLDAKSKQSGKKAGRRKPSED